MNTTPSGNRTHIGIFGKRNAGKSSLLNAITEQKVSLVSDIGGTTTDPVKKAMELLPYGPVLFIDTAGLDDVGVLGELRKNRAKEMFTQIDFALIVHDINDIDKEFESELLREFKRFSVSYMIVINKLDSADEETKKQIQETYPEAFFLSTSKREDVLDFKKALIDKLSKKMEEETIIGDLLPYGSHVVLVVPIDSEAPNGRIILPQVQLIRDALDHGIICHVVRDTELSDTLERLDKVDLVVTDSQAFQEVSKIVPEEIPLTSFSILFARQKGDLKTFYDGIKIIESLPPDARILMAEICTHNTSHEDIGRYKIPALLKRNLGESLRFEFFQGNEYPQDVSNYDLVVHCGGCMMTKKQMNNRLNLLNQVAVPVTNYGVLLAWGARILERSMKPFKNEL